MCVYLDLPVLASYDQNADTDFPHASVVNTTTHIESRFKDAYPHAWESWVSRCDPEMLQVLHETLGF